MATARLGIVTPTLATSPTDIPADLLVIAARLDLVVVKFTEDTHANRPAAGTHGFLYYETDTGIMFYDNGTTWQVVGANNRIGLYAARPVATAVPAGTTYYATDKDVSYISDATSWYREGTAPGDLFVTLNSAASTGRVLLQGQAISRVGLNDELFAKWGTTYGAGNGTTTFNVPDMRSRAPVAAGTNVAVGANDGVGETARRGLKHRHTPHTHTTSPASARVYDTTGSSINSIVGDSAGPESSAAVLSLATADGGSGVSSDPLDGGAFFGVQMEAKL